MIYSQYVTTPSEFGQSRVCDNPILRALTLQTRKAYEELLGEMKIEKPYYWVLKLGNVSFKTNIIKYEEVYRIQITSVYYLGKIATHLDDIPPMAVYNILRETYGNQFARNYVGNMYRTKDRENSL